MVTLGAVIAVIVALGQLFKQLGVPNKYLPLISLVLGVVGGLIFGDATLIQDKIMIGLMTGLSSAGLYDQSKIIYKK